jgi:hypothetical protein
MSGVRFLFVCGLLCTLAGVLVPWWPLCAAGIAFMVFSGWWFAGVAMGLVVDLIFGVPNGSLALLLFPFTALSLAAALIYWVLKSRLRSRASGVL